MAIVKVKLMTQYLGKDGTHAVVIYVNEVKPQYVKTGYRLRPDQFKEIQDRWVCRHPDAVIINSKLEELRQQVIACVVPGVGYVKGYNAGKTSGNFCDYLRHRAEQYRKGQQEDMHLKCNRMAFELAQVKGRDIYAHEVDANFIREFKIWCESPKPDKNGVMQPGNVNNTVMRKIKNLRYIYDAAIEDGKAPAPNPFKKTKLKFDKVLPRKLTREQIRDIENLQLTPGTMISHVRNAFLFSFFCQGMRFEKVVTLSWGNVQGTQIIYENNKGSAPRTLEITSQIRAILSQYEGTTPYIFPFIKRQYRDKLDLRNLKGAASAMVNEFLKIIGAMVNITDLQFHRARHAFAYAAKKKGVRTSVISDSLGHGDEKITADYLDRLDDDEINQAVSVVWE